MTELTPNANMIYKMKYAEDPNETWDDACLRVTSHVGKEQVKIKTYFELMNELIFLPGGRVIANSGTEIKNLLNCFTLKIEDSRESIYSTLKDAAEVFAHGGGCGYNFSHIRETGATIKTTGGTASGPLSFLSLFDQTGEVIQQSSRRGAQLAVLNDDHMDILDFIDYKSSPNSRNERILEEYHRNLGRMGGQLKNTKYYDVLRKTLLDDQLTHFNVSVGISDKFMKAFMNKEPWNLKSVSDEKVTKTISSEDLITRISERVWESGDPGVLFLDRINKDNMVPYIGKIEACNPCSEATLLPYEACDLGSINLHKFYDEKTNSIDFEFLEYVVRSSVRFLDDVLDVSEAPIEKINYYSKGLRRLGLGVFGFADLLAELEIPYNSQKGKDLARYLSWFISFFTWLESMELSKEKGPFPLYNSKEVDLGIVEKVLNSEYNPGKFDMEEVRKVGLRNVSVTAIAPTGSIALIAGENSGIEPFFALAYKRSITQGIGNTEKSFILELNPVLFNKLNKYGIDQEKVKSYILENGSIQGCELVPEHLQKVFATAMEINWKDHIDMQASWQEFVTNAVSKTINMENSATVEDIKEAFIYAWGKGLKGITAYRDGSKSFQILNVLRKKSEKKSA